MAWPKGKPRNPRNTESGQSEPATPALPANDEHVAPRPVSLVEANRFSRSVDEGLRARREGVVKKCLAEISSVYGADKATQAAPLLRDILDGKPIAGRKPKPLRGPINA